MAKRGTDTLAGFRIRPARVEDAADIARLFLVSSDGLAAYIWSKMAVPGLSLEETGAARYARTGTEFSYENCLVATVEGAIVGMVHAYPMVTDGQGADEQDIDPVLRPYAELEDAGSLYVSGLAVDDGYRGRRIGSGLMDSVEDLARAKSLPRISLICFQRNEAALRFYVRRGFREVARRQIVPHPTIHYQDGDALLMVLDC